MENTKSCKGWMCKFRPGKKILHDCLENQVADIQCHGTNRSSTTDCRSIHKRLHDKCIPYKSQLSRYLHAAQFDDLKTCSKESWEHEAQGRAQEAKLQNWLKQALVAVNQSHFRDSRDKLDMSHELDIALHPNWPTMTQNIHEQCNKLDFFVQNEKKLLVKYLQTLIQHLRENDEKNRARILSDAEYYLKHKNLFDYGSHLVPFNIAELPLFYRYLKHFETGSVEPVSPVGPVS